MGGTGQCPQPPTRLPTYEQPAGAEENQSERDVASFRVCAGWGRSRQTQHPIILSAAQCLGSTRQQYHNPHVLQLALRRHSGQRKAAPRKKESFLAAISPWTSELQAGPCGPQGPSRLCLQAACRLGRSSQACGHCRPAHSQAFLIWARPRKHGAFPGAAIALAIIGASWMSVVCGSVVMCS